MSAPIRGFVWTLPAIIDRWIDGDSCECHTWLEQGDPEHRHVRLEGVNSPERGQAGYDEAKTLVEALCPPASIVVLVHSREEKYGRLLAGIRLADGSDLGSRLLTHPTSTYKPYIQR